MHVGEVVEGYVKIFRVLCTDGVEHTLVGSEPEPQHARCQPRFGEGAIETRRLEPHQGDDHDVRLRQADSVEDSRIVAHAELHYRPADHESATRTHYTAGDLMGP